MKRKILLIDDEPFLLKVLLVRLKHWGYDAMGAAEGPEGLEAMRKNCPDLVILDKEMPGMNGDQVVRIIKTDEALKHIPVMMISADVEDLAMCARGCGLEYYLAKPFEAEALLAMIKTLLYPVESQHVH
jgi:two-component system alkaline phosphatase synthesis response regulator PhoP